MMINQDGGIVDVSSVGVIINKLQLYIETEEKIISNIKKSLSLFEEYYSTDNNVIRNSKVTNLCDSLNTMLNNKKKYVDYLVYIVDLYKNIDEGNVVKFNSDIN